MKFMIRRKSAHQYLCDGYSYIRHASGFLEKFLPLECTVSVASNSLDNTISEIVFLHPGFELIPRVFLGTNVLVCNLSLVEACHPICRAKVTFGIWLPGQFYIETKPNPNPYFASTLCTRNDCAWKNVCFIFLPCTNVKHGYIEAKRIKFNNTSLSILVPILHF